MSKQSKYQQLMDAVRTAFGTITKAKLPKVSLRTWRQIIMYHENDVLHTNILDELCSAI